MVYGNYGRDLCSFESCLEFVGQVYFHVFSFIKYNLCIMYALFKLVLSWEPIMCKSFINLGLLVFF